MGTTVLALYLLAVALPCLATATLRVGAFNIQAFGDTKMSNEEVAGIITSVSAAGAVQGWAGHWGGPKMWLLRQECIHGSCAMGVGWHPSAGDALGG